MDIARDQCHWQVNRQRLPYGEDDRAYNLSMNSLTRNVCFP